MSLSGYIPSFSFFGTAIEPEKKMTRFDSSPTLAPLKLVVKKIHEKCSSLEYELKYREDENTRNKLKDLKYILNKVNQEIGYFNGRTSKTINEFLLELSGALCTKSDYLAIQRGHSKEIAKYAVDTIFGEKSDENTYTGYVGNRIKDYFSLHSKLPRSQELYEELIKTIHSISDAIPKNTLK